MAYYNISQVIRMRREALGHSRYEYDADGPSAMSVYRTEEKGIYVSEKNYRKLTKAMGEEESTRRGVLRTKEIEVLWLVNEISGSYFYKDYDKAEELINTLEAKVDCRVKRNQQYLDYLKAQLQYKRGLLDAEAYEKTLKDSFSHGALKFEQMLERNWPFHEMEWNRMQSIVETVRREKDYEGQKELLTRMNELLERPYMEQEYTMAYRMYVRWRMGDVLGNLGFHREAIELDEETIKLGEERLEKRYLAESYFDIFWNYQEIKKNETLTEEEELRCKECLIKAYYINKALFQGKKLYETMLCNYYPDVLV